MAASQDRNPKWRFLMLADGISQIKPFDEFQRRRESNMEELE
jgi:hypothetical protein